MSLDNFITGSSNVFGSLVSFAITLLEFTRILGFDANLYLQHFWLVSQLYKPDQERQSPLTMSQNFIKYGNAPLMQGLLFCTKDTELAMSQYC